LKKAQPEAGTPGLLGQVPPWVTIPLLAAREHGVPTVLGADAHAVEELAFMEFGVCRARRARLKARDVANTRPLAQCRKLLRKPLAEW
jgi:histidinol phosphatase-like PHP family hydrolase